MTLRIYVTGSIALIDDDRAPNERVRVTERSLPGNQGRLVLAMLIVEHRRSVSREEFADELWPDGLPRSWDVAIRALLSKIRAALAPLTPDPIAGAFGAYRWRMPTEAWLDFDVSASSIHRAEAALRGGDIDTAGGEGLVAAVIAARPLLAGLESPWIQRQRDRLSDLRIRALDCTGEVFLRKGDHGEAMRQAKRLLEFDPYHEPAARRWMRAAVSAGDTAGAARVYEEFRQRLRADLDVEPSGETMDLRQRLDGPTRHDV